MERVLIQSDEVPANTLPFSPALRVGEWVFVSGQGGFGTDGKIAGDTIEVQTEATMRNIERLLRVAGCELADVVTVLVHLSDLSLFDRYNAVYAPFFSDPKPTRTTVEARIFPGLLVEITVTAVRPG